MKNKPVAWMYEKPNGASKLSFVKEKMLWEDMTETPLYTHPVKELPNNHQYIAQLEMTVRNQQAEIEELEKENTDLRYLIATKLEQQDGISLNSMAHPVINTPEPSYEIDPDKLETIEIDLPSPEPVAWIDKSKLDEWLHGDCYPDQCFIHYQANDAIPLYTHQYERPHNTVLVPCDKLAEMQAEIEALKDMLEEEGIGVSQKYLDERIAKLGKARNNG